MVESSNRDTRLDGPSDNLNDHFWKGNIYPDQKAQGLPCNTLALTSSFPLAENTFLSHDLTFSGTHYGSSTSVFLQRRVKHRILLPTGMRPGPKGPKNDERFPHLGNSKSPRLLP